MRTDLQMVFLKISMETFRGVIRTCSNIHEGTLAANYLRKKCYITDVRLGFKYSSDISLSQSFPITSLLQENLLTWCVFALFCYATEVQKNKKLQPLSLRLSELPPSSIEFNIENVSNIGSPSASHSQPRVVFHIEINHLICTAHHVTDFQVKCNNGLKWA